MINGLKQSVATLQEIINQKNLSYKSLQILIANDIQTSNMSIEHACEVMDCLIDTLERGMNEHQHFEGYIEEHIHCARWVISKIFEDANSIQKAVKESETVK